MKSFISRLLLVFSFFCSNLALAKNQDNIGYSSIILHLKGDYPKVLNIASFAYGNILETDYPLKINKINDSTYYASFLNLQMSNYYLVLNKEYFTSYIEPNQNDTLEVTFADENNFEIDYKGKYKDLFYNSNKFVEIIKNYYFINSDIDTWTRETFDCEDADDLKNYIIEKSQKQNKHLRTITDNPTMISIGAEVIEAKEIRYALQNSRSLSKNNTHDTHIEFYQTIFKNKAELVDYKYPGTKQVFLHIIKDSVLNLPDILQIGPYQYENRLKTIFGESLGQGAQKFYERVIALAYIQKLDGGNTFTAEQKFDILNFFNNNIYKTYLINKSNLNSTTPISNSIHYLPFDNENEDVLGAIISKYKNKVILIDYWATWCGPCIQSFETMQPLKEKYKDNQDIVFLYLTDESSEYNRWKDFTEKLAGEHYYLTKKQLKRINTEHNINAIPHYMLIDKNGEIKFNETFPTNLNTTINNWIDSVL